MILTLIQIAFFTFYILYIWTRYGVQKSISDSWYTVDDGKKWMFTVVLCFAVGILHLFNAAINSLFFFSGTFLCFTGVATAFKDKGITNIVHFTGAFGAIVFSLIALCALGIWWTLALNILSVIILYKVRNKVWWMEIVAFYSIMLGMLQYYLNSNP